MKKIKLFAFVLIGTIGLNSCGESESTESTSETTTADSSTVTTNTTENQVSANVFGEADGPQMTFEKIEHNFGEIKQGDVVKYPFKFTNTGSDTLYIYGAATTCGCTTSKLPENTPILPGSTETVEVQFNSKGKSEREHVKDVKIHTNVFENKEEPVTIKIKATVVL